MRTARARHAHGAYLQELPRALQWLREELLPELAWPLIARAFPHLLAGDHLLPHLDLPTDGKGGKGGEGDATGDGVMDGGCAAPGGDARAAIRVSEAFVVRTARAEPLAALPRSPPAVATCQRPARTVTAATD